MSKNTKPIESYSHAEKKRSNLPTEQTERFMEDKDKCPENYTPPIRQRNAPLLSWDRHEDLELRPTLAHPLYIHEKIHPAHFVQSLCKESPQGTLFEDFNNLPENAEYEWYQHLGNWQNRLIRGDSVRIMASLAIKEQLEEKVQMVYFDPPYGISFKSNFQARTDSRNTGEKTSDIPQDLATVRAFRDTYENGIHSYFDNIYQNATLARALLNDTGSFFLQMGSANVHRLAVLLDEVFGAENHVATIPFAKSGSTSSATLPVVTDFLLWYAKDKSQLKYNQIYEKLDRRGKITLMNWDVAVESSDGSSRKLTDQERENPVKHLSRGNKLYRRMRLLSPGKSTTGRSESYEWQGKLYHCLGNSHWRVSKEGLDRLASLGRLAATDSTGSLLAWKRYENEMPGRQINNLWHRQMSATDMHYVVETAEKVIEQCILMTTNPADLVLDITCGSGTTPYVAEKWGRRWMATDTSGVAISLARQRLAAGIFDYHLLQDSLEGAEEEAKLSGKPAATQPPENYRNNVSKGFVYERVPKVSAAILAYEEDVPPTLLVNRPMKKRGTTRVSSPFTVESESPHRHINPEKAKEQNAQIVSDHVKALISALEISGIRTGKGDDRVSVKDITDWTGKKITHMAFTVSSNGTGEDSQPEKTALTIAPDDMTVPADYINRAAEEAANIHEVTKLLVLAFAFEPSIRSDEFVSRGKIGIMKAQANRDLQIGNLSDNHTDNAFVLIGEPDVQIKPDPANADMITVELLGYDTYDPATGNTREGNPEDIDCWMVDSAYDGLAFYARFIHFPNKSSDGQIRRLKTALGRKLEPAAWNAMLSLKSLPFSQPKSGRIAVRIITTTHTEMTSVFDTRQPSSDILHSES